MNQEEVHKLLIYQKKYFDILTEFFVSVTGKLPHEFASLDGFSEAIKRIPDEIRGNSKREAESLNAFSNLEKSLRGFYSEESIDAYRCAKNINACKLNLGGGSGFLKTHLHATRKSLLFADIILIPDPIMPWIERERSEERFRHIKPLQMAFFVLQLSDLISDNFDIPPFFIFPSWEKTLEDNDEQTQKNCEQLITDVFSHYINSGIKSSEDILDCAKKSPNRFLSAIDKSKLFVSPGGIVGESLIDAIDNYKLEMQQWRSEEWCKELFSGGNISIVLNGIFERIAPHYHLLENSDELKSHPFLCIATQAHYYQLIARMKNEQTSKAKSFDHSTIAILNALTSHKLDFLANIEDSQLIQIRKSNENIEFRRSLRDLVNSLPAAKLDDLSYVASEVCSHIEMAISKHEKEIVSIRGKFNAKHKYTALIGAGTLGVTMLPVLSPFLSMALPLGLASTIGKYASEKFEQNTEEKQLSHSMMGVLSLAKRIH